ncbi:hypothetical protein ACE4Z6_26875, partial [Salmonella enterica]|uniref:hypothetical protein n=1 Tax=Salmonella enterica TaxID=28901 RepID=UPI003D2B621C
QIDCDWTLGTKEKYFSLLKRIKERMALPLSCTIRLHQVKYQAKTGVPPVDRGMLMYYNMGHVEGATETNSIYDPANADKYVSYVKDYPLPLDV